MRAVSFAVGVCLVIGCASAPRQLLPPPSEDDPAARAALVAGALDGHQAAFVLTWEGRRIGDARERFFAEPSAQGGYRFERIERVTVRRDDARASATTTITIDVDAALQARSVTVLRQSGGRVTRAEARRLSDDGWQVTVGRARPRLIDGAAVPATLVPLLVKAAGAQGRAFAGPVLVEGAALAAAELTIDVDPATRLAHARISTRAGELRSVTRLDAEGHVIEAGLEAALSSTRVDPSALDAPFDPPDLLGATALPVTGSATDDSQGLRLRVAGVAATPPVLAELPGQRVIAATDAGWEVEVSPTAWPQAGTGAWRDVATRVHRVARELPDDLAAVSLTLDETLAAGRGDCTAHAVVLEHDLRAQGYNARLVTGFVLEDGALRRHRWVVVQIGKRWVPVDPMFDEVPAQPTHIALAVHGSSPDELAFIDDVVFAPWRSATAHF
jgi:hypothetical protein